MSEPIADAERTVPPPLSPITRSASYTPSPTISPTTALLPCPPLGRSFSTSSTFSDVSARSSLSRVSGGSATSSSGSRRRGYVRPQAVAFADSARARDSVMSLGSIAHVQHYFARTGYLDGKGGRQARETSGPRRSSGGSQGQFATSDTSCEDGLQFGAQMGGDLSYSPIEELPEEPDWDDDGTVLPPTVSTYNHQAPFVPPPPDTQTLRQELQESLGHVTRALDDARKAQREEAEASGQPAPASNIPQQDSSTAPDDGSTASSQPPAVTAAVSSGWHELQGMHMLDVATLAIKSAKDFYQGHEHPKRLHQIKSERQIREELYSVLDALKRVAARHFASGFRPDELNVIDSWVEGVRGFLSQEAALEEQEQRALQSWTWLNDNDWEPGSRWREHAFLTTFLEPGDDLPVWTPAGRADALPTPFLAGLANGRLLVHLHNRILARSRRQFGEIKTWHKDTERPYRAAENLRFWIKAAEIRWEVGLEVDVMGVVYARGNAAWNGFEEALVKWCRAVREEMTREWKAGAVRVEFPPAAVA